ncbi:maleylpyruvate isomerase N-terminal domain-containing protein [Pelolinea submarina]|uniref:Mycothiol maleylpyruvate isomerase-like protein n=1 Tax=Pelolinea submarina TaxID=913107 RepID=A0A347ZP15_9CHLR|nr:maleylpyruvate isomerase N-terminal domain-containing protein [Pelolinea submarina]REG08648.1 mycothiol maleylpyruvate isomerase-like protein [Pelolinea submarina]BBB47046.1 eukaryotic-like serine/threonine-protein kinase [Pelolinea submarina]
MNFTTEMFDLLESIREELDDLVQSLTPEEKARRGSLQGWSAKDMLVHLAFWNHHFNRQLEQGFAGQPIPKSGDYLDQVNDGVLYEHLEQPFDEALADESAAYSQFRQIVAEVSPEDIQDSQKFEFLEGHSLLDRALGTYGYHTAAHISDYYIKHGQIERARALQESITKSLLGFPGWEANAVYNLGCFYSLNGYKQEAIAKVKEAFEIKSDLVEWAKQDSDLDALRDMAEYKDLIGE